MKRKISKFIGFIGVIAIISAAASGYFFQRRMNHVLQKYAFMIKSQTLMLKERGEQIKDLGAVMSSYAQSQSRRQPSSSQDNARDHALQKYAAEVRKNGQQLEQYAEKMISDIQATEPVDALVTIGDMQPFVPENLETIKKQRARINELEIAVLKHKSRIDKLRLELHYCITRPKTRGLYPPEE